MKPLYIKIKDNDNVAIAIKEIKEGTANNGRNSH